MRQGARVARWTHMEGGWRSSSPTDCLQERSGETPSNRQPKRRRAQHAIEGSDLSVLFLSGRCHHLSRRSVANLPPCWATGWILSWTTFVGVSWASHPLESWRLAGVCCCRHTATQACSTPVSCRRACAKCERRLDAWC